MSENMNKDWVCSKCGTLNSSGNFCAECGEPKPAPVAPAPAPAPSPAPTASPAPSKADEKTANLMCTISVVCMYASPILTGIVTRVAEALIYDTDVTNVISSIFAVLTMLAWLTAIVLMIYVRVKYPKNVFGKVIMWIYIGQAILTVILVVVALVACAAFLHECSSHGAW